MLLFFFVLAISGRKPVFFVFFFAVGRGGFGMVSSKRVKTQLDRGNSQTQNHRHPKIAATSTSSKDVFGVHLPPDAGGLVRGVLVCGEWCHEAVKTHGKM